MRSLAKKIGVVGGQQIQQHLPFLLTGIAGQKRKAGFIGRMAGYFQATPKTARDQRGFVGTNDNARRAAHVIADFVQCKGADVTIHERFPLSPVLVGNNLKTRFQRSTVWGMN